nr:MAG TPA: hypothetical protein [Caudoviricetes sp.]
MPRNILLPLFSSRARALCSVYACPRSVPLP